MTEYRKATIHDADEMALILKENYNIDDIEEAKKVMRFELDRRHFIVAVEDGKIVGLAGWRVHGLPKHQLAEVLRVAVMPEYKGKGVATDLFKEAIQDADRFYKAHDTHLRKIYVYVHSSNTKAQEFYTDLGLIKEAELKDHYYKGEGEYIYSLFME